MARVKKIIDASYQGLDLDYRPFDDETFAYIVKVTRKKIAVADANRLDQLRTAMNTAAISLEHDIQLSKTPSDTTEKKTLEGMLASIKRLRPLFHVTVTGDHGLAPGDEPAVPYGVRKLLEAEIERRLKLASPITDWSWTVETSPEPANPSCPEMVEFPHRDDLDLNDVAYTQHGANALPPDPGGEPSQDRPAPDYDPEDPELFFRADNAHDILIVFSNLLALLEASAKEALALRMEAPKAERATPERTFVLALIPIYCELFNARPTYSVDSLNGTPTGPLIRFLSACLRQVEDRGAKPVKPETLRKYIDEYKRASHPNRQIS